MIKTLDTKLSSGDPLTLKQLLQISFKKTADTEITGEESKQDDLSYDDAKVQKLLKVV